MSDTAKQLFEGIKQAVQTVAPGLSNIGADLKAEMSRLGTQGSLELASAIFGNGAFVPYGPGQQTAAAEQSTVNEVSQEPAQENARGGMER